MGLVKWLGRVFLWLLFPVLGLWRSLRRGRKKSEQRIIDALNER